MTDGDRRTTKSADRTTARVSPAELKGEPIKVLGRREPLTVESGSSLGESLRRMQQSGREAALVCRGGALVGIVTERDVLMKVVGRDVDLEGPVDAVMTADPDTLPLDATIGQALEMMERGGYRNLPLVDAAGALRGLLRQQDVLEYVAEAFPQEILNLPPRPHQAMPEAEGA